MKKTHKVVMLPCEDKQGSLHISNGDQHLYIISDDEIKEGDWYYTPETKQVYNQSNHETSLPCRKIVATTDNSLEEEPILGYERPLSQIPESFIQAYIKAYNEGKHITEVDLEMSDVMDSKTEDYGTSYSNRRLIIKTRPDNTVIIHQSKMYSRDEVKKLLGKVVADSNNPKYTIQDRGDIFTMDRIFPLDKWIQDNL